MLTDGSYDKEEVNNEWYFDMENKHNYELRWTALGVYSIN